MNRRARIGVFVDDLLSPYQIHLFNSIKRAASSCGMGVIGFQGSFPVQPDQEQHSAFDGSFIYGLAGEESVDGLVVLSNVLSSRSGIDVVHTLCRKSKLPIVSIGRLSGVPSIVTGADEALAEMVGHLVQYHSRSRIALIEGPAGNQESLERSRIVKETLEQLSVPLLESHIVAGDFLEASGSAAVRILLDQRGVQPTDIDAVIALNDQMAVGAVYELTLRGIHVPNDISVVGFDDDDFARSANPPLTTISQPIERMGARAIQVLISRMRKEPIEDLVVLDAEPVWRRSCGCDVPHVSRYVSVIPGDPIGDAVELGKPACYERYKNLSGLSSDARTIETVIAAIEAEHSFDVTQYLQKLESDILRAYKNGIDPLKWHDVLSPLSDFIQRGTLTDGELGRRRERRMRAVHLRINEVAARIRALDHLHTMQWAHSARILGSALLSVRHVQYLSSVLNAGLPSLGIRYCCVCLFVGPSEPREARVAALYSPNNPPEIKSRISPEQLWAAAPGSVPPEEVQPTWRTTVFPASELVHPRLHNSSADVLDLSVYPLVYAHATLGYVVFDAPLDAHQSWLLEGLAGSLSSAVYAIQRNAELREARDRAEKANAAKSEFVAMISHEVRTPLTAVIGHLDLCLQTELSREQTRHLQQAVASSHALIGIVNDILDFSKIEAQRIELENVPFALDEVLDQVIGVCAQSATRKGLSLIVDADPDIPHWLRGDPLRLGQVLLNLVGNSVKFSAHGAIRVTVQRVSAESQGALCLRFLVEDDGIGMEQEIIDRIFEPFTQGDGSMTRKYGGTGLGLTISRKLVNLMNGDIKVASEPGKGSRFEFQACFKPCELPMDDLISGENKHILVATANPLLQQALEHLLVSYGFKVKGVNDADAGLEMLRRIEGSDVGFDLLIGDIAPFAFDVVAFVLQAEPLIKSAGTRVLMLSSAESEVTDADEAALPNLAAVIQKPFQRRYLTQVIAHTLSAPRSYSPRTRSRTSMFRLPPGVRILVVQDDAITCEMLCEMLSNADAEVFVATTGNEAVEIVKQQAFDLILQDLHLPDIDGYTTARTIRMMPNGGSVPILALSASSLQNCLTQCLAAGINDFIEAPVEVQTLIQTIRRWIGKERSSNPTKRSASSIPLSSFPGESTRASHLTSDRDLDIVRALVRLEGNRALFARLLDRFMQSNEGDLAKLRQAIEDRDQQSAALIAHTLSSTAANIGASGLRETAQALENSLRNGESWASVEHLLIDLEMAVGRTVQAVETYLLSSEASKNIFEIDALKTEDDNWMETADRLRTYIEFHDSAALDQLRELRAVLGGGVASSELFQKLETALSAYDFEQARIHLNALMEWLRQAGRPSSPAK